LTSWGTTLSARDDRGDRIGATYSFLDPFNPNDSTTNQLRGNAELVLTDRVKFGLYSQYDLVRSTAIEQAVALRFVSACNCWHIDVGMSKTTNPDNQRINIRFALTGLGDLAQGWMYRNAAMMGQTQ
jgi:lipopolysaccharide assembly outer membrane protein LptD (OstA)